MNEARKTVLEVVDCLRRQRGTDGGYRVSGEFRAGDIGHGFAHLTWISAHLGYLAMVTFTSGSSASPPGWHIKGQKTAPTRSLEPKCANAA